MATDSGGSARDGGRAERAKPRSVLADAGLVPLSPPPASPIAAAAEVAAATRTGGAAQRPDADAFQRGADASARPQAASGAPQAQESASSSESDDGGAPAPYTPPPTPTARLVFDEGTVIKLSEDHRQGPAALPKRDAPETAPAGARPAASRHREPMPLASIPAKLRPRFREIVQCAHPPAPLPCFPIALTRLRNLALACRITGPAPRTLTAWGRPDTLRKARVVLVVCTSNLKVPAGGVPTRWVWQRSGRSCAALTRWARRRPSLGLTRAWTALCHSSLTRARATRCDQAAWCD